MEFYRYLIESACQIKHGSGTSANLPLLQELSTSLCCRLSCAACTRRVACLSVTKNLECTHSSAPKPEMSTLAADRKGDIFSVTTPSPRAAKYRGYPKDLYKLDKADLLTRSISAVSYDSPFDLPVSLG